MMKSILLLSSSRVHGYGFLEHARDQLVAFLNKRGIKKILFIPYALRDYDKYEATVHNAISPWGYHVHSIHMEANAIEAVRNAEAIFVGGGNTFVLLRTLYEKQLIDVIREVVLEKGVPYIGSSAGTNVATRSINTTNDMPVVFPPSFEALQFVPFNINPHYLEPDPRTKHKGETRDERINEFIDYNKVPVLALREGTALLIENDHAKIIGDRNVKLFRPEVSPEELEPDTDVTFLLKV